MTQSEQEITHGVELAGTKRNLFVEPVNILSQNGDLHRLTIRLNSIFKIGRDASWFPGRLGDGQPIFKFDVATIGNVWEIVVIGFR